jgi:hypothetical protein
MSVALLDNSVLPVVNGNKWCRKTVPLLQTLWYQYRLRQKPLLLLLLVTKSRALWRGLYNPSLAPSLAFA